MLLLVLITPLITASVWWLLRVESGCKECAIGAGQDEAFIHVNAAYGGYSTSASVGQCTIDCEGAADQQKCLDQCEAQTIQRCANVTNNQCFACCRVFLSDPENCYLQACNSVPVNPTIGSGASPPRFFYTACMADPAVTAEVLSAARNNDDAFD